jgi:hypothetical protein
MQDEVLTKEAKEMSDPDPAGSGGQPEEIATVALFSYQTIRAS